MHKPLNLKDDYINLLLDVAAETRRERGTRIYEVAFGIPIRDIRLLRIIGNSPGIRMSHLVAMSGIEKTLASKLIGALVRRELVERHIGKEDARHVNLCLTQAGVELVSKAEPMGEKLDDGSVQCLSAREIVALKKTLRKLIASDVQSRESFEAWFKSWTERKKSAK